MKHKRNTERWYIHGSIVVLCIALMPMLGVAAAAWSWLQITVVVELIQWQGRLAARSKTQHRDL